MHCGSLSKQIGARRLYTVANGTLSRIGDYRVYNEYGDVTSVMGAVNVFGQRHVGRLAWRGLTGPQMLQLGIIGDGHVLNVTRPGTYRLSSLR